MVNKITTPPSQKDVIDKVNELVDGKQDTLVSGINIKTINNTSILGSGNIDIQGGETYTAGDGIDITNGVISVDSTVALKTDVPTITDTYSATSSDGMSGKAVASAISGKADSSALSDYIAKNGGSAQQNISLTSGTGTTPLGIKSMSNSSYISFSGSSSWLASFGINSSKKPVIYDGSSHTIAYTTDIPTNNNQLTNGAGYITSSALSDYVPTTRTVNSKALSADITLTASDVGALPSSTVIPTVNDATLTITQGGVSKGTFTANASSNATIALDAGAEPDNSTISLNTSNKLQTIGVINQRSNDALKIWQGTEAQWNNGSSIPWYNWETSEFASYSSETIPSSKLYAITYGDGKFVACGYNSESIYSTDGVSWTSNSMPGTYWWKAITYGDGKFVACGSSSKIAYSTDGVNWSTTSLSNSNWQAIGYGNGVFVAFNSSSKAIYSTDGINWNEATISFGGTSVAYGKGKFIVVGTGAAYSTDGTSWTSLNLNISVGLNPCIAFGNDMFIIVGRTALAYSTDGTTWKQGTKPFASGDIKIIYGNGVFVAFKYGATVYSTDGINWTSVTVPTNIGYYSSRWGNGKFVMVSDDRSTEVGIITFSSKQCYTDTATPTTSSTVYSAPDTASALTVSSVTSGAITLSDNNTYYYNSSGTAYTYQSVGVAYPDWLCFINGVGVKIGTTVIATYNGV